MIVMAIRPQRHELLAREERRRSVTHLLGDAGIHDADRPKSFIEVSAGHRDTLTFGSSVHRFVVVKAAGMPSARWRPRGRVTPIVPVRVLRRARRGGVMDKNLTIAPRLVI